MTRIQGFTSLRAQHVNACLQTRCVVGGVLLGVHNNKGVHPSALGTRGQCCAILFVTCKETFWLFLLFQVHTLLGQALWQTPGEEVVAKPLRRLWPTMADYGLHGLVDRRGLVVATQGLEKQLPAPIPK